jgi:hypothetical protein
MRELLEFCHSDNVCYYRVIESALMAPNIIIYCLEDVTDYFEFERLCHDLMAEGLARRPAGTAAAFHQQRRVILAYHDRGIS